MTVQGAIDCLSNKCDCRYCDHKSENCRKDAENIAIKSLEAWGKVKNDLGDLWLEGYSSYIEVMDIIDKHMKGVKE